jgi:hypothetical protein
MIVQLKMKKKLLLIKEYKNRPISNQYKIKIIWWFKRRKEVNMIKFH